MAKSSLQSVSKEWLWSYVTVQLFITQELG